MTRADLVTVDGVSLEVGPTYSEIARTIRAALHRAERLSLPEQDQLARAITEHVRAWRPLALTVTP